MKNDIDRILKNMIAVVVERAEKAERQVIAADSKILWQGNEIVALMGELAKARDYIEAQDREIMLLKERRGELLQDHALRLSIERAPV